MFRTFNVRGVRIFAARSLASDASAVFASPRTSSSHPLSHSHQRIYLRAQSLAETAEGKREQSGTEREGRAREGHCGSEANFVEHGLSCFGRGRTRARCHIISNQIPVSSDALSLIRRDLPPRTALCPAQHCASPRRSPPCWMHPSLPAALATLEQRTHARSLARSLTEKKIHRGSAGRSR